MIADLEVRVLQTKAQIQVMDLPTVKADALQMRQLFQNLVQNALKFHRPGIPPVIKVGCEEGCQDLQGETKALSRYTSKTTASVLKKSTLTGSFCRSSGCIPRMCMRAVESDWQYAGEFWTAMAAA